VPFHNFATQTHCHALQFICAEYFCLISRNEVKIR